MATLGMSATELRRLLRLPSNRGTFALAVAIRLFWLHLVLFATVGLLG